MLHRACRLLTGQPSLQRWRRVAGGPAAFRFLTAADPGPYKRPRGRAPRNAVWDALVGQWVDSSKGDTGTTDESSSVPLVPTAQRKRISFEEYLVSKGLLDSLVEAGEQFKAQELFDRLLDRGKANEHHLHKMLQATYTSAEMRKLASRAKEAGVAITAITYNTLLSTLLIEGRADEAEGLQREMVQRGIDPDKNTAAVLGRTQERLSKKRFWLLARLLKHGKTSLAWTLFDGLLERGLVDEYHLTTMLKVCPSCDEQRALVQRVEEAGVPPAVAAYNMLLSFLHTEGRTEDVEALQQEMAQRGIEPNELTARVLARSAEHLSKMRTITLVRMLDGGETSLAWTLFDRLLERGLASEYHLTTMLKACLNSHEQRALMSRAEEAGMSPAVSTYNLLFSSLRFEGRTKEVEALQQEMIQRGIFGKVLHTSLLKACLTSEEQRALVLQGEETGLIPDIIAATMMLSQLQIEARLDEVPKLLASMDRWGIERDARFESALDRPEQEIRQMQTTELGRLLAGAEPSRRVAAALFDTLCARRLADEYHLGVMMFAHSSSAEQRGLAEQARQAGVALGAPTFTLLLGTLLFEGRTEEAGALQQEIARGGINSDEVLARSVETCSRMNTTRLIRLLKNGETSLAWKLFDGLLERGFANRYHLSTMLSWACSTHAERDTLDKRARNKLVATDEFGREHEEIARTRHRVEPELSRS